MNRKGSKTAARRMAEPHEREQTYAVGRSNEGFMRVFDLTAKGFTLN
jgi:hypothetical protein